MSSDLLTPQILLMQAATPAGTLLTCPGADLAVSEYVRAVKLGERAGQQARDEQDDLVNHPLWRLTCGALTAGLYMAQRVAGTLQPGCEHRPSTRIVDPVMPKLGGKKETSAVWPCMPPFLDWHAAHRQARDSQTSSCCLKMLHVQIRCVHCKPPQKALVQPHGMGSRWHWRLNVWDPSGLGCVL